MARSSKKIYWKQLEKICFFCLESRYSLLDVHRIREGGAYSRENTVIVCCRCHRLIHGGFLFLDKYYSTSRGIWILRFQDKSGKEHWEYPPKYRDFTNLISQLGLDHVDSVDALRD